MPGSIYTTQVRVFHAAHAAGNRHHLVYARQPDSLPALDPAIANLIHLSGPPEALQVTYANYGQAVLRCGSGSLAVATFIKHHFKGTTPVSLRAASGAVVVGFDRASAYYLDEPLTQRPLPAVNSWQHILGQPFLDGCYCGSRGNYALLEVDTSLQQLRPHLRALCQLSQRAQIVLQRTSRSSIELRYFAPQYGPAEDAATGSASVQAAAYMRRRYGITQLHIQQRSPSGGVLRTEHTGRRVRVRGKSALNR